MASLIKDIITSYEIRKPEDIGQTKSSRELIAFDVLLLCCGLGLALTGLFFDVFTKCAYWFSRLNALTTIICLIISFRSLNKHYRKLLQREEKQWTSRYQIIVDKTSLWFLAFSTIFWAFGDDIIKCIVRN